MKALGFTSTAVLSLLLCLAGPAWAQDQHEQEQKDKPAHQEEKKAEPQKSAKPTEKPAAQQDRNANNPQQNAQHENNARPEQQNAQQQKKNAKPEEKGAQQHTVQGQSEKRPQRADGGRIPNDRFKASFGQEHRFRVSRGDYDRDRHFQYGGYSFGFVDPWPSNWLYTQDVYVVEINGVYYLCNAQYPGVNITLSIVL
jgi:hypothetical protein